MQNAQSRLGSINDPHNQINMNFPSLSQANPSTNFPNNLVNNMSANKKSEGFAQYDNNPFNSNTFGFMTQQKTNSTNPKSMASESARVHKPLKTLKSNSSDFIPNNSTSALLNLAAGSQGANQMINSINQQVQVPSQFNPQMKSQIQAISQAQPQQQTSHIHMHSQSNAYPQSFNTATYSMATQPFSSNIPMSIGQSYLNPSLTSIGTNTTGLGSLNSSISTDYTSSTGEYSITTNLDREMDKVIEYIANLKYPEKREEALQELSKKRESFPNLAPYLWYSVGTVAILLQEIVSIYPLLSPQSLSQSVSNKVCNVLGLLQCLALHQETRGLFLNAHIPLFLYPFLNTSSKSKPFENLRVTSLGVIGALVKGDDSDAINFLMQTEIIPLCLRIMKRGQELSRTVATFIVQKILLDDAGLNYICQTGERFCAVCTVLAHMVEDLVNSGKDDQRLLRHIIRCYHRLADNSKAREALKQMLPDALRDPDKKKITDEAVKRWHAQLLENLRIIPGE